MKAGSKMALPFSWWCARHGVQRSMRIPVEVWYLNGILGGGSPLRALVMGIVSRTARVSPARGNLKEAARKVPARGTRSASPAGGYPGTHSWARRP